MRCTGVGLTWDDANVRNKVNDVDFKNGAMKAVYGKNVEWNWEQMAYFEIIPLCRPREETASSRNSMAAWDGLAKRIKYYNLVEQYIGKF